MAAPPQLRLEICFSRSPPASSGSEYSRYLPQSIHRGARSSLDARLPVTGILVFPSDWLPDTRPDLSLSLRNVCRRYRGCIRHAEASHPETFIVLFFMVAIMPLMCGGHGSRRDPSLPVVGGPVILANSAMSMRSCSRHQMPPPPRLLDDEEAMPDGVFSGRPNP